MDGVGAFDEGLDIEFLKTLEEFCQYIHKEAFGSIWSNFVPNAPGDVRDLIHNLYSAQAFEEVIDDSNVNSEFKMDMLERCVQMKRGRGD